MQKPLGGPAQIRGSRKIRLRARCLHFDKIDGRARGKCREKIFIAVGVEI
jgi:hypothetical protein